MLLTLCRLIRELHSIKSDAGNAKQEMDRLIISSGEIPSQKDIAQRTKDKENDFQSKKMINAMYNAAGLQADI